VQIVRIVRKKKIKFRTL